MILIKGLGLKTDGLSKARYISQCLELGVLLESSATKPGNVNRTTGFEGTNYAHFLASAVALSSPLERATELGEAVSKKNIDPDCVGIGRIIRDCVENINEWQHGGNTLLGTVILLSPVAVAAGMTPINHEVMELAELRRNLRLVVESTTPEDAVNLYEAIRVAKPGGLGTAAELDVNDPTSVGRILEEKIRLFEIFKMAEGYDMVCSEWVNNYPITFDVAHSFLKEQLEKDPDLDRAVVYTFLKVLAECPDTLIARKTNKERAREVSEMARQILESDTGAPRHADRLSKFDNQLRRSGNLLNPGTTADIIAAALAINILNGYRP